MASKANTVVVDPHEFDFKTNSYVAISMYKKLGFEPYKGEMPINFHANAETFKETNDLAWKIIDECIEKL